MPKLQNINTTSIRDAIRLGCRTMQNVFNSDDDDIPFFESSVLPDAILSFDPLFSEAHVPGRHLNALLNAEHVAGVTIDESAVQKHRSAAFFSFSGPLPLPLNRQRVGGPLVNFTATNLREGLHALYALVRFRDDSEARELAERYIATVMKLWQPDEGWDLDRLRNTGLNPVECQGSLHGEARMLGPLVKFYGGTGWSPALQLALLLKEKLISEFYLEDGHYDPQRFITRHSHSITSVMSSLAQLADLLADGSLLMRLRSFYDNGLWDLRDEIGWAPEKALQFSKDRGEVNITGDILETALILGRWGYPEYYHDAERILRCHLLPSQLRDVSFIRNGPNPSGSDELRAVADRHLGAFGFPAPYGHEPAGAGRGSISYNMDIVGGAVGSLCEAYREVARYESTGHWVNLLFDHETGVVHVRSPYTHDALGIEVLQPGPLFVRIPPWIDCSAVAIEGCAVTPISSNGYLYFGRVEAGQTIRLRFPLMNSQITLAKGREIPVRVKLRGDSVEAMDNFGAEKTFFDSM